MEAENDANVVTEERNSFRESRSRSNTPPNEFTKKKVVSNKSANARGNRRSAIFDSSIPIESPVTNNNGLTAKSESYSETVTFTSTNVGKTVITTNSSNKVRRSGRPKVNTSNQLANGGVKKNSVASSVPNTKIINSSKKKVLTGPEKAHLKTSDYSSDEEEKYKTIRAYRTAGEWWNVFPKTDFTYSPASACRTKEVAPGVLPVPNMSRRSLASLRNDSGYSMPFESETLSKQTSTTTTHSQWFTPGQGRKIPQSLKNSYWASPDSDIDDVDEAIQAAQVESSSASSHMSFTAFFVSVWSIITTTWTKTVEVTRTVLGRQSGPVGAGYMTPTRYVATPRTWWSKTTDWLYVMFASVQRIDARILSWFNTGSGTIDRTNRKNRRMWLLLLLIPLLFLCGCWYYFAVTDAPLSTISSEAWDSLVSLGSLALIPFASYKHEKQVTSGPYEPMTKHIAESALPSLSSIEGIDLNRLTTEVVNSQQMKMLLASNRNDVNMESLITHIVNSKELHMLIAPNQKNIDVKSLTAEIIASGEIQKLIALNHKELDLELLTYNVLRSSQMEKLLLVNQKEIDIDLLVSQIIASEQLQDWVLANQKELDVDTIVAQIVNSGQLQKIMAVQLEEINKSKQNLAYVNMEVQRHQELEKKNALLESKLAQLSGELARIKDQMEHIGARLNDNHNISKDNEASLRQTKASAIRHDHRDAVLRRDLKGLEGQLRLLQRSMVKCCNKPAPIFPTVAIEQHVTRFLASVFGRSGSIDMDPDELRSWIGNMFVAKNDLEARLANLTSTNKKDLREASEHSAETIMSSISDRISEQFILQHQRQMAASHTASDNILHGTVIDGSSGLSGDQVRAIVNQALMKYDADKTGMVDHALESSGGQVISTRCSETYYEHSATLTLFGIPLWHKSNNPRSIIQPGVHPGECWAFRGSRGFAVLQLVGHVRISSFTLEHIPRSLAFAGNIDSAPKDFTVLGLNMPNDPEPTLLGKYVYQENGTSLQHFIVQRTDLPPFKYVELQIESNHGNMAYTCLYRFRVHGTWIPD